MPEEAVVDRFFGSLSVTAASKACQRKSGPRKWAWILCVAAGLVVTGALATERILYYSMMPTFTLYTTKALQGMPFPILFIAHVSANASDCEKRLSIDYTVKRRGIPHSGQWTKAQPMSGAHNLMQASGLYCPLYKLCADNYRACRAYRSGGFAFPTLSVRIRVNYPQGEREHPHYSSVRLIVYLPSDHKKFSPKGPLSTRNQRILPAIRGRKFLGTIRLKVRNVTVVKNCTSNTRQHLGYDYSTGICKQDCMLRFNRIRNGCDITAANLILGDESVPTAVEKYCPGEILENEIEGVPLPSEVLKCFDADCRREPCNHLGLDHTMESLDLPYEEGDENSSMVELEMSYESLNVDQVEERYMFTSVTDYLTDLGGTLGVIIGGCLLTVLELLDFVFVEISRLVNRATKKQSTQTSDSKQDSGPPKNDDEH